MSLTFELCVFGFKADVAVSEKKSKKRKLDSEEPPAESPGASEKKKKKDENKETEHPLPDIRKNSDLLPLR